MTKEYTYYPYIYCHEFDALPQRVKDLLSNDDSKYLKVPHIIRKIYFIIRNDELSVSDLICSIDYFMCTYLFPLESNGIYWELYVDIIYLLLEEERLLFKTYGINNKAEALPYFMDIDAPDFNQMYNRMTLYKFIAACYKEIADDIRQTTSDMVFQFEYDVRHILEFYKPENDDKNTIGQNIVSYLAEITNWLSAEARDGGYLKQCLVFYEKVLSGFYMTKYYVEENLPETIKGIVIQDFKDVVKEIITDIELNISEIKNQLDREKQDLKKYESYICDIDNKTICE